MPSQVCTTRDNTELQGDGIVYFPITRLAQTLLRSGIGKMELNRTFEERESINASIVSALDEAATN